MDFSNVILETERLKLIPLKQGYEKEVFKEFDDEITTYMFPKPLETIEQLEEHNKKAIEELKNGEDYHFYVLDKNTEEFLGRGGLHNTNTKTPELGIWLKKSAHGHKYGREAIAAVKEWADENIDYEYIMYPVDKRNIASRKIAESLGGKIMKEYKQINMAGNELDEVEYYIYKEKSD